MRFYVLISTICVLIPCAAFAQPGWERTFGGVNQDCGYSVQQTSDGGYIVAGSTGSFGAGNGDVYLIKTDASGNGLWSRFWGGTSYDAAHSVRQTSDTGYIVTGSTGSFGAGNGDVWLIKTNAAGDTLWTRTLGGIGRDGANAVAQTASGGYIIAGFTTFSGSPFPNLYLVQTDASGNSFWSRACGGDSADVGYSVQQTLDGGYVVTGYTASFGAGSHDVYLIKTNANGDTLWTRTYGGDGSDEGYSVQQTSDTGYIIAGQTSSYGVGGDVWLVKTNAFGDTLWTRTYGGTGSDVGESVRQTLDGGYIVAGYTGSFGNSHQVYLVKTNAFGDTLWTRSFGGDSLEIAYSVQQTSDTGYIAAGLTSSYGSGAFDVYLIKTDANGRVGVEETPNAEMRTTKSAAFLVRGELLLGPSAASCRPSAVLLDISGRKVMELHPGRNDVSRLGAGVYFVRQASSVGRNASGVSRVVIAR